MTGVELIAAERQRQVMEEGYTSDHDDTHTDGALAIAAASYALPNICQGLSGMPTPKGRILLDDRIEDLTKAGALIAAEIDRLIRARDAWGRVGGD